MKIIFFGSDDFVIPVLQALEENFEVSVVITAPDSPISKYFKGLILTPDKLNEEFVTHHSSLLSSDLIIVSSYGKIIPQAILDIPKFGAINVHPSLLPKYRGASPVPATILAGDKETGVTIIQMDEKMDHGPIIYTSKISLTGQENLQELINKLFQLGAEVLVKVIPDFVSGKIKPQKQDHTKATFCKLMSKEDGYFDINLPPDSEKLDRMTRAYYPWPGVWTTWNGHIVKFFPNQMIQMEGKKVMSMKDFLNGYPNFPLKV